MISPGKSLKNIFFVFGGRIATQFFGLVIAIILARYLGPEDYGKYSFAISFCYIFMVFSDFGLNDLFVRDIAADRSRASKYFAASLVIKPLLACLSLLSLYVALRLLEYSDELILYTMIFSLYIFFITQINTIAAIFRSYEKMEYNALITIIYGTVGLLIIVVVVYINQPITHILFSRVFTFFLGVIVSLFLVCKKIVRPDFNINLSYLIAIAKKSFPFLTIGFIHTLYFKVDIIMLSKLKGDIYVGFYTPAANDLFFGLFIIPGTIATVVYPIFSRQYGQSLDRMRESVNFTIKILTILGVAISVGTFVLAPQIIHLIFGPQYENSVIILQIMALAISFAFVKEPLGFGIASICKEKFLMWMNAFFLVLNIILNAILIPLYAHVGAALTSVFCIIISLFLGFYVLKREIKGIFLARNFFKPVIAAMIMGVFVFFLRDLNLILTISFGALVYALAIFLVRTFNDTEIAMLKSIVRIK